MARITKILIWFVSAVLVLIVAGLAFIKYTPGYSLLLVRSESMTPSVKMGDLIVTAPLNGEVKPGTIITYERNEELITHRLLSTDGENLVTKGDATEDPDPWPVTLSDIKGIYLVLHTFLL